MSSSLLSSFASCAPVAGLKLEDWADISQIVVAVIAALALLGAVVQIMQARSAARETLTYNFTHRFSHPEFLPYHQKTNDLFDFEEGEGTANQQWDLYESWSVEEKVAALLVPNLIEEMAGMYNKDLLQKQIARDFFGYSALTFWRAGWWFIKRSRESNPEYYRQWQTMLEDMNLLSQGDLE